MKFDFEPFEGASNLKFGMKREEIRNRLNLSFEVLKRNEYAENSSDFFEEIGLFVEYNKDEVCEALEFSNESCLIYQDRNLFKEGYSAIRREFDTISSNIEIEEEIGVTYYDLGISITESPTKTNNIESIMIFSETYW